jgi:membrane protein implicated in regulation of membrane protease activity
VARETAQDIADDLKGLAGGLAQPLVDHVKASVTLWVLAIMFVPIGLAVLILSAGLLMTVFGVIGTPTGTAGSVTMIVWIGLTLAAMFVVFRFLFRRVSHRVQGRSAASQESGAESTRAASAIEPSGRPITDELAAMPSLAELDARLAPKDP